MGLVREAPQGRPEGRLGVVDGHDDRDQRPGRGPGVGPPRRLSSERGTEGSRKAMPDSPERARTALIAASRAASSSRVFARRSAAETSKPRMRASIRARASARRPVRSSSCASISACRRSRARAGFRSRASAGEIEGGLGFARGAVPPGQRERGGARGPGRGRGIGQQRREPGQRRAGEPAPEPRLERARRRPSGRAAAGAARAPSPRTRPGRGRAAPDCVGRVRRDATARSFRAIGPDSAGHHDRSPHHIKSGLGGPGAALAASASLLAERGLFQRPITGRPTGSRTGYGRGLCGDHRSLCPDVPNDLIGYPVDRFYRNAVTDRKDRHRRLVSENEIVLREARHAGQRDLEVGPAVAVHVARQDAVAEPHLARVAAEPREPMKSNSWLPPDQRVGVDRSQVDQVLGPVEIGDDVAVRRRPSNR